MKGRTAGVAFRQTQTPQPLLRISDPAVDVRTLVTAIARIQRYQGCGSYLFIDPSGHAYVVAENRAWMQQCLRELHRHAWFPWLVGYYAVTRPADPRIPVLRPTEEGVLEDMADYVAVDALARSGPMPP